jgi:hypothetical protein
VKELRPPHRNAAAISKSHLCISIDFACAGLHFEDGGAKAPAKEGKGRRWSACGAVTTVTKHGMAREHRSVHMCKSPEWWRGWEGGWGIGTHFAKVGVLFFVTGVARCLGRSLCHLFPLLLFFLLQTSAR